MSPKETTLRVVLEQALNAPAEELGFATEQEKLDWLEQQNEAVREARRKLQASPKPVQRARRKTAEEKIETARKKIKK